MLNKYIVLYCINEPTKVHCTFTYQGVTGQLVLMPRQPRVTVTSFLFSKLSEARFALGQV